MKTRTILQWISASGFAVLLLNGCSRAPAYDLMGSLFPAWLVCIAIGCLLSLIARAVLVRLRINVFLPLLAYPSLAAIFTFTIWLFFY
jgi:hypothetical protein